MSVTLFRVPSASSPPPFSGDPPVEEFKDTEPVKDAEEPDDKQLHFRLRRPHGFYYLAVSIIAYFDKGDRMVAQVERFFPMRSPCPVESGIEQQVELAVDWPDTPLDQLHHYGTFHPRSDT